MRAELCEDRDNFQMKTAGFMKAHKLVFADWNDKRHESLQMSSCTMFSEIKRICLSSSNTNEEFLGEIMEKQHFVHVQIDHASRKINFVKGNKYRIVG